VSPRRGDRPPVPEPLAAPVVDAHTHLDASGATDADGVRAMVDRAESAGVDRVVTVADDVTSAQWAVDAASWDPRVFAAVAVHPTRTSRFGAEEQAAVAELAAHPRVVAVGETGLDYYWNYATPRDQQVAFRWHIDLAKRLGKPLMIHDRDAHDDVLSTLDDEGPPDTVIFHSYSGDLAMTKRCVDAGYVLSFSGTVTFRNAPALHESAQYVPATQLLVETDAPFLTPHPFRGRPNEPYCTAYTVRALARLRSVSELDLCESLRTNAERVFGLDQLAQRRRGGWL
jgi:TatD DNase family protein